MTDSPLPVLSRIWFAWVCYFRVLFDSDFARRAWAARAPSPPAPVLPVVQERAPSPAPPKESDASTALVLLALLQREGRLVDFLQQDVSTFSDSDVGAAARVVHDGCRKALLSHASFEPVRAEDEDSTVTINDGFAPAEIKLVGDVKRAGPYKGKLVHRGWRVTKLSLPTLVDGHDPSIVAPAEVEL